MLLGDNKNMSESWRRKVKNQPFCFVRVKPGGLHKVRTEILKLYSIEFLGKVWKSASGFYKAYIVGLFYYTILEYNW